MGALGSCLLPLSISRRYRRNHTLSSGPLHGANSIIVRISTDEGISGAGEASISGGPGWWGIRLIGAHGHPRVPRTRHHWAGSAELFPRSP